MVRSSPMAPNEPPSISPTMKTIFLSKTFWLQIVALVILIFPPVAAWMRANPVDYLAALAAANVLLRFFTSGAVTILPGSAGPETSDTECDDTGPCGRLPTWLLLASLGGVVGFSSPGCSAPPPGTMAISGEGITDGAVFRYDPETGLGVIIDQRKTRPVVNGSK
jgi:hypothetical protein